MPPHGLINSRPSNFAMLPLNCWRGPGVTPAQMSSPLGIGTTRLHPASSWVLTVAITVRLCAGLRPWRASTFSTAAPERVRICRLTMGIDPP